MSSSRLASTLLVPFAIAVGCSGGGSASSSSSTTGSSTSTTSSSTTSSSTSTSSSSSTGSGGPGDGGTPAVSCTVAQKGTAGIVLQGTVLTPSAPLTGEVFVDGTGKIACVAASCSTTAGYGSATVLSCPDAVISPGLINAHDHTEYDTLGPVAHGTTRWDHRNGWRTGTGGEPLLMEPMATTDASIIASAQLRFVLGRATSVIGSGGVHGLLRNLAAYPDTTMDEG